MRNLGWTLLLVSSVVYAGPVYKCVDEEGHTHYSNSSTCGSKGAAEHVEIKESFSAGDPGYTTEDVNRYYRNKWSEEERRADAAKQARIEQQRINAEERRQRKRDSRGTRTYCQSIGDSFDCTTR
ncbi:MAG: DUF4124 domain-containing protein [Porticoccus sp.]|nr:DUF4124 domain-containing protein [Porticoccus sp.]